MTLGTAQLNNQLASQLTLALSAPYLSYPFSTHYRALYYTLLISIFEQKRVRCNQLKKMTMTLLKLLSDEEEGFPFSERHSVTQTKK